MAEHHSHSFAYRDEMHPLLCRRTHADRRFRVTLVCLSPLTLSMTVLPFFSAPDQHSTTAAASLNYKAALVSRPLPTTLTDRHALISSRSLSFSDSLTHAQSFCRAFSRQVTRGKQRGPRRVREESTKQRQSSGTTRLHEKTRDKLRKRAAAADSGFRLTRGGALRTENDTETASSGVSHRHASGTDAFTRLASLSPLLSLHFTAQHSFSGRHMDEANAATPTATATSSD